MPVPPPTMFWLIAAVAIVLILAGASLIGTAPQALATHDLPCPDVDGDGDVDAVDLDIVMESVFTLKPVQADVDGSGSVTAADLAIVAAAIGTLTTCQDKVYIDTDLDGCTDLEERGDVDALGGERSPNLFWDFFDVPTPPTFTKDTAIAVADITAVVARFGSSVMPPPAKPAALIAALLPPPPPPAYSPSYDRTFLGPDPWDTGPPNGSVTVADIALVVAQFGDACIAPP